MRPGLPNLPQRPLPTSSAAPSPSQTAKAPAPPGTSSAEAARQEALRHQAAQQALLRRAGERLMALTAQYSFRQSRTTQNPSPRANVPLQRRPLPRPNPQPARPAAAAQRQQQTEDVATPRDDHEVDSHASGADADRERKRGKMDFNTDDRGDTRDSFHGGDDGSRREKRQGELKAQTAPRRGHPPATQVLARSGLMEAAALFVRHGPQARDPKAMLDNLCAVLVSCAAMPPGGPNKPSPAAVMLAAQQVHLASQNEAPIDPLRLDQVKAMLMARHPAPDPAASTTPSSQNAWLLLPLQLLNATRPRTPSQLQHAVDRIALLRTTQGLT